MIIPGTLTQVLVIDDVTQVGNARRVSQQLAALAGFDDVDAGRVALVATELASNIHKHAQRGELHLRIVPTPGMQGVEIIAIDRGDGFNIDVCLADGYSTGGTQGIGLGAISRMAQVFDVFSDTRGSVVLARIYAGRARRQVDRRFGVSHHSMTEGTNSGDTWSIAWRETGISALVIDGLGHGDEAANAAIAGAERFADTHMLSPVEALQSIHQAMMGTRGGAAAMARFDTCENQLHFVGIGNIGASLETGESSRGLASHPGIVGLQFRTLHPLIFSQAGGQLLIMHSDGLQSRWRLSDYPGLWHRHPAVIAALLHRDFCRGRDDATVLVVALEAST
ncbi:ATP-binding protein [Dyella sp.]|uniref:ATP-binding protein n=1 Tax=Dyella sp. TaxID=1869338 RepID=UPI002ED29206